MTKSFAPIYKVFYIALHLLYSIFESVCRFYRRLKRDRASFSHGISAVNKVPRHLTVILGPEQPHLPQLADLIVWCLGARIPFVTFYDHKGALECQQDDFRATVDKKIPDGSHVIWHGGYHQRNGYSGPKIHVKVLTENDGRSALVESAKDLILDSTGVDNLEAKLSRRFEFPEPDMGLCCGQTMCLYGYPPWHVRVTEFFLIETHHHLSSHDFALLLHKYDKCEQRFGK